MTMRQSLIITIILAIAVTALPAAAQQPDKSERKQWFRELREYKHGYFTKELGLSREQQDQFFPLYDAMEDEIAKLNNETRDMEQKVRESADASDLEYEKATEAIFDLKGKEYDIEKSYFSRFDSILTKKQMFLLKGTERQFSRELMRHHRRLKAADKK